MADQHPLPHEESAGCAIRRSTVPVYDGPDRIEVRAKHWMTYGKRISERCKNTLLVCLLIAVLPGGRAAAQSFGNPAAESMQLLKQHDYVAAAAAADRVLAGNPENCPTLTVRGLALQGEGKREQALLSFAKALEFCPAFLPALEGAAQLEYDSRAPGAESLLKRILQLRPDDMTTSAMLAAIESRAGACTEAIPHFQKSAMLIERSPAAEHEYGACLAAEANWDMAVEVYARLLQQEPTEANRLALASAQSEAGHFQVALETMGPLVSVAAPDPGALRMAAEIAEKKGDTPQAVRWLRQAIVLSPRNIDSYLVFAALSFAHSSFQVGIDMLNVGLKENPKSAQLYLARGVLLVQLSRLDAALRDFSQAHALDPTLSLADDALGMLRSQQHQPEGAMAIYRKAAQTHPDDALLEYLYAESLSKKTGSNGAPGMKAAIKASERAVALEPGYGPARDLLCALLVRSQQFNAAVAQAEEARRRAPEDQQALYQEIMAERHLGDKARLNALVARLNQLRMQEQGRRTQYLLYEPGVQPTSTR
jgi:tetratricopeptide (TPR) repeat protein